jgi:hypothetical protein
LITFDSRTVETIDAIGETGHDKTGHKDNLESRPSVNAITTSDSVPQNTILGGKYDIKLLQEEDSDFKHIVAYLKNGTLDPDAAKARKKQSSKLKISVGHQLKAYIECGLLGQRI